MDILPVRLFLLYPQRRSQRNGPCNRSLEMGTVVPAIAYAPGPDETAPATTLANSAYVAKAYGDFSLRNEKVSFSFHEIAAPLEPEERRAYSAGPHETAPATEALRAFFERYPARNDQEPFLMPRATRESSQAPGPNERRKGLRKAVCKHIGSETEEGPGKGHRTRPWQASVGIVAEREGRRERGESTSPALRGIVKALRGEDGVKPSGWPSTPRGRNGTAGLGLPCRRGDPARCNDLIVHPKNKNNNTRKAGAPEGRGPIPYS